MVLIRIECTSYTTDGFFGEIINTFQDRNKKNPVIHLKEKKTLQTEKDSFLFN